MKKIFVSGCYDILHAGHVQFFKEAKALGDHLTVCFASDRVLWEHKTRRTSLPQDHKLALISDLEVVDEVVIGGCDEIGLDFKDHFLKLKPDVLAVTEDDQYGAKKRALCEQAGAEYVILPKTPPAFTPVSTSFIVRNIRTPAQAPLRLDLGVGWQDPAIIRETGVCVWRSGEKPVLHFKRNGDFLYGHMALHYTDIPHDTPGNVDNARDLDLIEEAGHRAKDAVMEGSVRRLGGAIGLSYKAQLGEGMRELPDADECIGRKYCGGGWGGYALYLFAEPEARDAFVARATNNRATEPYITIR